MFRPNPKGFRDLEGEPEFKNGLAGEAKRAASAAKGIAAREAYDEGDYHDSIRVVSDGRDVYLSAFDYKAWWIEAGSINNEPSAPLRRGAQMAGLRFKGSTKT